MNFKTIATFVAHVVRENDPTDQGILYIRIANPEHKPRWAKISVAKEKGATPDVVYFETLHLAIEDARNLSRLGEYTCETDIAFTPFNEGSIQHISDYLEHTGYLKVV